MLERYCLKWKLRQGEQAEEVRARIERDLDQWAVRESLVGIPALDNGGFLPPMTEREPASEDNPFGCVSAMLALSAAEHGRLAEALKSQPANELLQDPLLAAFDASPMPFAAGSVFGNRTLAHRLIGAQELPPSAKGLGVNVVIIDEGFDQLDLDGARFGGGWWRYTTDAQPRWVQPGDGLSPHARMVARNVLKLAPEATIWDVPLLRDTLEGPPSIALAEAIFYYMWRDLRDGTRRAPFLSGAAHTARARALPEGPEPHPLPGGPWVLVNAWGVLDPSHYEGGGAYVRNPHDRFVVDMPRFSHLRDRPADLVFAAGNCGEPTPVPLCGESWTGPEDSILGVNAHPDVLTVGALRVDGVPNGYSAQGPGALASHWPESDVQGRQRAFEKPDLCAPSGFHEDDDASLLNTGTSAAAALMGGVIAALRSHALAKKLSQPSPAELRTLLRDCARPAPGQVEPWDPRLGHGIVDVMAVLRMIDPGHK